MNLLRPSFSPRRWFAATVLAVGLSWLSGASPQALATVASSTAPRAGVIAVSPGSLTFPATIVSSTSGPQQITVSNPGSVTLKLKNVQVTGARNFSLGATTCGGSLPPGQSCEQDVTFVPARAGSLKGKVHFKSDAKSGTDTVTLTGTGVSSSRPALQLSPASVDFGGIVVGGGANQTITLTNSGKRVLKISHLEVSGTGFNLGNGDCVTSLSRSASCTETVSFQPAVTGATSGAFTVTDNAPGSPQAVPLSGTGLAPAALIVSPGSANYGSIAVGAISPPTSFTVSNTGDISTGSLTTSLTSGDFQVVTDNCADAELAAGASCTVAVAFQPTSDGPLGGTFEVSGSPGGSASSSLSGNGLAPAQLEATPASLDFGSVDVGSSAAAQTVTITNVGDQTSSVVTGSVSGDGFSLSSDSCSGSTLSAGASCSLSVVFAPTDGGPADGTVSASASAGGSASSSLTGSGLAPAELQARPASLDFGNVDVGSSSSSQSVTITNIGGETSGALTGSVSGDGFSLSADSCSGTTLAAGASCSLSVNFAPTDGGPAGGTVSATASPGGSASSSLTGTGDVTTAAPGLSPASWDFGSVNTGSVSQEKIFTYTNTSSSESADVTSIDVANPDANPVDSPDRNAGGFELWTDNCTGQSIGPAESCSFGIVFVAPHDGPITGSVTVTTSLGDDPSATLTGTGVGDPILELSTSSITFDPTPVGQISAPRYLTITNAGTGVIPAGVSFEEGGNGVFFENQCSTPLGAGQSCTIGIIFEPQGPNFESMGLDPTQDEDWTDTLDIYDAFGVATTVSVEGLSTPAPDGVPAFSTVGVGGGVTVNIGSTYVIPAPVTITNIGTADLAISAFDFDNPAFSVTNTNCLDAPIPPGSSCTFEVQFSPTIGGSQEGHLALEDNSSAAAQYLAQRFRAVASGAFPATGPEPNILDDGDLGIAVGGESTRVLGEVTIQNGAHATQNLDITSITLAGDPGFSIVSNTCPVSLSPGASCNVLLSFSPTVTGFASTTVTIADNAAGSPTILNLQAFGIAAP